MRNNDINDEDYGKEMPELRQIETPWHGQFLGYVIVGCFASILFALTVRLDRWLMH